VTRKRKILLPIVACLWLLLVSLGISAVLAQPPAADSAQFISQSGIPSTMQPGQRATVSITIKNTGTATWTATGGYKLGTQNPQDNTRWTGATRVYLAPADNIAPGQQKTFSFAITAPSTPGSYNFQWQMVHEGIAWFGALTPNVVITVATPAATDNAQFVSQTVPTSLQPGQVATVSITMKNSGTTSWTAIYRLGSQNPRDNLTWGLNRVYLAETIAPGQQTTFSFQITAPAAPGSYNFQWQMVHEGIAWFGALTPNVVITVAAPAATDNAQFISQSGVPSTMQPGQVATVSITMKNTGTTTWTAAGGYKLGTQNPQDNTLWIGATRVYLAAGEAIAPGQQKTFSFEITAPDAPGTYNFQWRMVHDPVAWFGDVTPNIVITVGDGASCPPAAPAPYGPSGTIFTPHVGFSWSQVAAASSYTLQVLRADDGSSVFEQSEIHTPRFRLEEEELPSDVALRWRVQAVNSCGSGPFSNLVDFQVVTGPPVAQFPMRPGLWPASDEESSSDDLDGDGISQITELRLAQAFFPTIWYDRGEDCVFPGGNKDRLPSQPGRLVYRVQPHPKNHSSIAITYVLLYARDCGDFPSFILHAHNGDDEPFAITLAPDSSCPLGYRIDALRTWAHWGTPIQYRDDRIIEPKRCQFGFSLDPTGRSDVVLSSENKHGNYLHLSNCENGGFLGSDHCNLDFTMGDVNAWVGFNAGEPNAQRHRDLGPLGFPGEEMWAGRKFCGGRPCDSHSPDGPENYMTDEFVASAMITENRDNAQFVSQSVPATLQPGQQATVSITMKNTGATTWTADTYKLGSQNSQDNTLWTGSSRVYLATGETIAPGQQKTFSFAITAPSIPASYNFQWQMVHEGVAWFGDITPNVAITVATSGGEGNCPDANPADHTADDDALQACLNRGGRVELVPGDPGYIIAKGIQITVDGTVLTSYSAPAKATLVAAADLHAPIVEAEGRSNFTIEHVIIDGNKSQRSAIGDCADHPETNTNRAFASNIIIGGANSQGFIVRNIESRHALCGTALQLHGSNFEVANNNIHDNGFRRAEQPTVPEPWSDGITTGLCDHGWIHDNVVSNNTDVGIIDGGGPGCRVENNVISQTTTHAFAGLAVHNFDQEGRGDHTDAIFQNNTITSSLFDAGRENGLDFGISVGIHPWFPLQTQRGTVTNNSVSGAVVNLAVDGYADGTITGNTLGATQGQFSHFINCQIPFPPGYAGYTVAHTQGATLQAGWVEMSFDQGACSAPSTSTTPTPTPPLPAAPTSASQPSLTPTTTLPPGSDANAYVIPYAAS